MSWHDRRRESLDRYNDPNTADNKQVRLALMARVDSGEITLEQAQAELAKIKREAKKAGRQTWNG